MGDLGRIVLFLTVGASLGLVGCKRAGPKPCPENMVLVKDRSTPGKELWCRSADGRTAKWIEYHDAKNRRQMCAYSGGAPEGSFLAWHSGGKTWIEGQYREGKKVGRWMQWDKSGVKVAEGEYRDGTFIAGAPVGLVASCEKMKP